MSSSHPRRVPWTLLLCLFLVSLPAVTPRIYASDEIQYFAYLRSLWFDHDLSFENEYRYFYDRDIARSEGFHATFLELETDAGRRPNFGTIGCAILWAPFYAAGDLVARAMRAAGRPVAVDGFSKPYIEAIAFGSAVYGAAAIALAMLAAARLGFDGLRGGLAIWIGTPLLFYMYVAPPMSHACSAFAVALFVWTWLRVRAGWSVRGAAALGAAGALMAIVREQDLFFVAGPALDFMVTFVATGGRRQKAGDGGQTALIGAALAGAASFAVVFLPQAIAYIRLNGHLGPSKFVTRKMLWSAPHAADVLLSPAHGYLFWTPLAALGIAGIVWMAVAPDPGAGSFRNQSADDQHSRRRVGVCLLAMVALQVYVGGSVESWTVAGGYGQRRFVALTALLVIGYSALERALHSPGARRLLLVLTIVTAYWNVALIAEFATGLMDRQRLEPGRNAYDAFVTLPLQAPRLAYRYLFNRSSFYKKTLGSRNLNLFERASPLR